MLIVGTLVNCDCQVIRLYSGGDRHNIFIDIVKGGERENLCVVFTDYTYIHTLVPYIRQSRKLICSQVLI